ncbi:type IV secretion system protein, partial [Aggregatibacter actinomycetemcomitans]|uniref:type IV secretion system protein n=1 Tax=Aggregatibacter actinomycetemcomitans TaxID=714 RepID=UPI00197C65F9
MKLKLTSLVFATTLLGAISLNVNASGIPVVDGAHMSVNVQNKIQDWMIEAKRWVETIKQFEKDYKNQQAQLGAITGITNISGFMNEAGSILGNIKNLDKWLVDQDRILAKGYEILSPRLKKLFNQYGVGEMCQGFVDSQKRNCEGKIIIDVVKQEQVKRDLSQVKARVNTINEIAKRMQAAGKTKEAQDLQNAMQTQIALLNADKIKMDIAKNSE